MPSIYSAIHSLASPISNVLKKKCEACGELAGRAYSYIQDFSEHMQSNRNIMHAIVIIITANTIFFTLINRLADSFDKLIYPTDNLNAEAQQLVFQSKHQRRFTNIFVLDIGFIGGSTLLFNKLVLPKITNYPLSQAVVLAITATAVVTRIILRLHFMVLEVDRLQTLIQADREDYEKKLIQEADSAAKNAWKQGFKQHTLQENPDWSEERFEQAFNQHGDQFWEQYKQKQLELLQNMQGLE